METKIKMWVKAKDIVTWFTGIVTSITKFLTWCDRVCLTPESKKGKLEDWASFDITCLEYLWKWVSERFKEEEKEEKPIRRTWWPEIYKSRRAY